MFFKDPWAVEYLLSKGADPNFYDSFEQFPIDVAADKENFLIVKLLLDYGANSWMPSRFEHSKPVNVARNRGPRDLYMLIKKDTDDREKLFKASKRGGSEEVKRLISMGIQPDLKGVSGSPLYWAIHHQNLDLIKFLLAAGADPNYSYDGNHLPLMKAIETGNPNIVDLLLDNGVDPHYKDRNGMEIFAHVVYKGNTSIVQSFINHGADVNYMTPKGSPVLFAAIKSENPDKKDYINKIKILMKNGADPSIQDSSGKNIYDVIDGAKGDQDKTLIKSIIKLYQLRRLNSTYFHKIPKDLVDVIFENLFE